MRIRCISQKEEIVIAENGVRAKRGEVIEINDPLAEGLIRSGQFIREEDLQEKLREEGFTERLKERSTKPIRKFSKKGGK